MKVCLLTWCQNYHPSFLSLLVSFPPKMCQRVEKAVKGSSCCSNKGSVSSAILGFWSLMVMKGISTSTLYWQVWRCIIKDVCSDNSMACQDLISHCVWCPSSWLLWLHWTGSLCKKKEQVKAFTTDSIFSTSFSTWKIQHYYLLAVAGRYLFWCGQTWLVTSDMRSPEASRLKNGEICTFPRICEGAVVRGKAEGQAATKLMCQTGSMMKEKTSVKLGRHKEIPSLMK